jgi:hypothetical protein
MADGQQHVLANQCRSEAIGGGGGETLRCGDGRKAGCAAIGDDRAEQAQGAFDGLAASFLTMRNLAGGCDSRYRVIWHNPSA